MSKQITFITAFPIDRKFQESIGIYDDGNVHQEKVGKVMHQLIGAGHTEINSFVEYPGTLKQRLTIHMTKP